RPQVPWAGDLVVHQIAFGERTTTMRAGVVGGEVAALGVIERDPAALELDSFRLAEGHVMNLRHFNEHGRGVYDSHTGRGMPFRPTAAPPSHTPGIGVAHFGHLPSSK